MHGSHLPTILFLLLRPLTLIFVCPHELLVEDTEDQFEFCLRKGWKGGGGTPSHNIPKISMVACGKSEGSNGLEALGMGEVDLPMEGTAPAQNCLLKCMPTIIARTGYDN